MSVYARGPDGAVAAMLLFCSDVGGTVSGYSLGSVCGFAVEASTAVAHTPRTGAHRRRVFRLTLVLS